ncbi:AAEL009292-PA [Aedes aegypti]|uniref:AAEL009292-PA n=1 Tax=Aedes aegypti TaxID=7159 RepID=Q16W96_AEDAE|nr:AAEL009292-PA [Aedes aegypti]
MSDNSVSSLQTQSAASLPNQSAASGDQRVKFLVNSELLSDVTFSVGQNGTLIYGHRFPLAAASEVFYEMFTAGKREPPSSVNGEPIAVPDIEPDTFLEMLKFVYYDNPTIREDNLVELYYAGKKYNLSGLRSRCQQFVCQEEASVIKVFTANVKHGFEELNQACLKTICANPLVIFRSSDFLELPLELVEKIAVQRKLRCNDDQLLDALKRWAQHQDGVVDRHEALSRLKALVEKQQELNRDYQCRKWLFFGPICYTVDACKGTFHVTALKHLDLHGVGIYVGCHENEMPVSMSILVMSGDKMIRRWQANVPIREDIYVYDCMFERISLRTNSKVTIICDGPRKTDGPLKKFTFWNRGFTWTGDNSVLKLEDDRNYEHTAIAYILYRTKDSRDSF